MSLCRWLDSARHRLGSCVNASGGRESCRVRVRRARRARRRGEPPGARTFDARRRGPRRDRFERRTARCSASTPAHDTTRTRPRSSGRSRERARPSSSSTSPLASVSDALRTDRSVTSRRRRRRRRLPLRRSTDSRPPSSPRTRRFCRPRAYRSLAPSRCPGTPRRARGVGPRTRADC